MNAFGFARIAPSRESILFVSNLLFEGRARSYALLVQITAFSWFSIFKTALHRYQNCTNGYPFSYNAFSHFIIIKWIKCTN